MAVRTIATFLRITGSVVVMVVVIVTRVVMAIEKPVEEIMVVVTNRIVLMLNFHRECRADAINK